MSHTLTVPSSEAVAKTSPFPLEKEALVICSQGGGGGGGRSSFSSYRTVVVCRCTTRQPLRDGPSPFQRDASSSRRTSLLQRSIVSSPSADEQYSANIPYHIHFFPPRVSYQGRQIPIAEKPRHVEIRTWFHLISEKLRPKKKSGVCTFRPPPSPIVLVSARPSRSTRVREKPA